MVLLFTSCEKNDTKEFEKRLDTIEKVTVASLQNQIASFNSTLGTLQETQSQLSGFISSLQGSVGTLEGDYSGLKTDVDNLQSQASQFKQDFQNLQDNIGEGDLDVKKWVEESYVTLTLFNTLQNDVDGLKASVQTVFSRLDGLDTTTKRISEELDEAKEKLNGKLGKCEQDIEGLKTDIQTLQTDMDNVKQQLSAIVSAVQSVVAVPDYSDGSIKMTESSENSIRFEVYPIEAAKNLVILGVSALSLDCIETETKNSLFSNIPVTQVSFDGAVIILNADGSGLPNSIKSGKTAANARLKISDGTITRSSEYFLLSYKAAPAEPQFRSDYTSGLLASEESLELAGTFIKKNVVISATIESFPASGSVRLARGRKGEGNPCWIDVDREAIKLINASSNEVFKELAHGMTFNAPVNISVDFGDGEQARITLSSGNEVIEFEAWYSYSCGQISLTNLSSDSIQAQLRFFPKDATCRVWVIGDSYINWLSPERWPYYIYKLGYKSWLGDHLAGATSKTMLASFKNDLQFGHPNYVLWMMGMNDGSDIGNAPREQWLKCVTEFISLCEQHSITPVLSTVPSVPAYRHTEKAKWVRESGYRFIDIAAAVEKDPETGQWYDGFLAADNIHPAAPGAEAMARRLMLDFPEITFK